MQAPIADPRYLVPCAPKRTPHYFTDVLIVGGGLAGLRAAVEIDPRLEVLVLTKDEWRESNSNYAQGGIAAVMDPEDCFADHVRDTMVAGGNLCDPAVVEMVVQEAPNEISKLIAWGTHFDEEAGSLLLGREGGHGHNRIVHALGDATGKEIMRAVTERVRQQTNVHRWNKTFTLDLLAEDGVCCGALTWNPHHGKTLIWAKQTILCTGGAGQLYRETTNPAVATADGHAMAYRAGAELRDVEFMQFHPTVLYIAGGSRSLISEAVRGEGAYLVDCQGHRFMPDYDPRAELAPRDVVAGAIVAQMEKTRHPNVYLDLEHLDAAFVYRRFPGIRATCAEFGIDIAHDRIPVRPGAHYMIGGLTVDRVGRTSLPGLWAAGEVTSTGLHGANRLASNSLLEGLVYGASAGRGASEEAMRGAEEDLRVPKVANPPRPQPMEPLDLVDIRNSLQSLMWRSVGVRRHGDRLAEASRTVENWCQYVLPRQFTDVLGWELQNMLMVARLMIRAALAREESRGVHLRSDFVQIDDVRWKRHLTFTRTGS